MVVSGFQVATKSNLNPSCIELGLGFGLDNGSFPLIFDERQGLMKDKVYGRRPSMDSPQNKDFRSPLISHKPEFHFFVQPS